MIHYHLSRILAECVSNSFYRDLMSFVLLYSPFLPSQLLLKSNILCLSPRIYFRTFLCARGIELKFIQKPFFLSSCDGININERLFMKIALEKLKGDSNNIVTYE